jgi:ketosteroid isomerase-like protein
MTAHPARSTPMTTARLQAFADAWNSHDVDMLMSFMAEDCEFLTSAGPDACGARHAGRDAVRAAFAEVFERVRDAHWGGARHVVDGDRGLSQWTLTGSRADGTRVDVDGVDVFTFRDGLITVKDSYLKTRVAPKAS